MGCGSSVQVTPAPPDKRLSDEKPSEKQANGGKIVRIQDNGKLRCPGESSSTFGGVEPARVPDDNPGKDSGHETDDREQEQTEENDDGSPQASEDQAATEHLPELSLNTAGGYGRTSAQKSCYSEVLTRKENDISNSTPQEAGERTNTTTPPTDDNTNDHIHGDHVQEHDAGNLEVYDKTSGPTTILSQGWGQSDSRWDLPAIVLDCGTDSVKAGFAGEDTPRAVVPTIVGTPRHQNVFIGADQQDCYIGDDAMSRRGVLSLRHPVVNRYVKDWDDWEKVVHHVMTMTLRAQPDRPVLLIEPAQNPTADRERMTELLFESFEVPGLYLASQAVLALFASGRTTGVVVDCGAGLTHVVPVYEGAPLIHAIQRIPVAGQDITEHLGRLLAQAGHGQVKTEIVNQVKNQLGYVALDYDAEVQRSLTSPGDVQTTYELPDGQVLSVGAERFMAPEVIFRPELIGKDCSGLPGGILTSIMQCDVDLRSTYLENVFLSGGTVSCPGLTQRLARDLAAIAPEDYPVMVQQATPDTQFSAWKGGAVLAGLRSFQDSWITVEDFEEYGPSIVHRRL